MTFSPLKEVIHTSHSGLVSRIEGMEESLKEALIEKNRALATKAARLETELATLRVTAESDRRLLAEKSAQLVRVQESLDTVMERFLSKL